MLAARFMPFALAAWRHAGFGPFPQLLPVLSAAHLANPIQGYGAR